MANLIYKYYTTNLNSISQKLAPKSNVWQRCTWDSKKKNPAHNHCLEDSNRKAGINEKWVEGSK